MKYCRSMLLTVLSVAIFGCSEILEGPEQVQDQWVLESSLESNGADAGTFVKVESSKSMIFKENGKVTTQGSFCSSELSSSETESGLLNIEEGYILFDCDPNQMKFFYEVIDDETLIMNVPFCREKCQLRFKKADSGE